MHAESRMTNNLTVVPSEVEESRGETEEQFRGILRLRFASLRMTIGYSALSLFVIRHSSFVILFMNLSPEKKIAGVLVPLFALRREDDLGIGDLGALREFIDWIAEIGFTLVQLLPINETGADNSPYNAISAMAIEPTTLHLAPGSPEDLTRNDFEDCTFRDRPRGPSPWPRKISAGQRTKAAHSREGVCEFLRSRRRKATIRIRTVLRRRIVLVARLRVVPRSHRAK